jgi:hypothetical protein
MGHQFVTKKSRRGIVLQHPSFFSISLTTPAIIVIANREAVKKSV